MTHLLCLVAALMVFLLLSGPVPANTPGPVPVAQVLSVTDGDTIRVTIASRMGWPPIIGVNIPVRLADIDAPELRGRCSTEIALARAARTLLHDQLVRARQITLHHVTRGKYFRLVAQVHADGRNVSQVLLSRGLARPYDGTTQRPGWCPVS